MNKEPCFVEFLFRTNSKRQQCQNENPLQFLELVRVECLDKISSESCELLYTRGMVITHEKAPIS